ncbi:MAG: YcgL domain-containing protein [Pseudomonadota bacterium]
MICQVYRSARHEGMYLYVERRATSQDELRDVPEALMSRFGRADKALLLVLDDDKQLANLSAAQVKESIQEMGFYLQMPPGQDEDMRSLALKNTKLPL